MELIDRKTALDLGLTTYFTGKACLKGHITARRVGCGSCIECRRIRTKRWREEGKQTEFVPAGKPLPSQEFLRECFDYIFETGQLIWRTRPRHHFTTQRGCSTANSRFANKVAGHYHSRNGYLEIRFDKNLYKGHRIIYKLLTGEDPEGMLDHIDGDVSNNRIENLRACTAQENARNSNKRSQKGKATSVYKGVNKHRNLWKVTLTINDNEVKIVRTFKTEIEAALCYDELAKEHYGEFAQLNFP